MPTEQQDDPRASSHPQPTFATDRERPVQHADLAREIATAIDRQPGDRVRVTWINGDSYRCNWWSPGSIADYDNPGMHGLTVTTHTVRQSRFLTVTKDAAGKLVIREHSRVGRP